MDSLEPLDPAFVQSVLSSPPFVTIEGITNVRTLGPYPAQNPEGFTRADFVFRSSEVSKITEEGKARLRALGITKVFDLRSDIEMAKYNTPIPDIECVNIVRTPIFKEEDYTPETIAQRFQLYAKGSTEAFMELYSQILDNGGPAFRTVFLHLRDNPSEGCLFHCTAGKDRTGVLAALILSLAGVPDDDIARDYELTRIGRELVRDMIMARLSQEPIFAADKSAALNMLSSKHEVMLAFLALLREQYEGVENYLKKSTSLSDEDLEIIRKNLVSTKL